MGQAEATESLGLKEAGNEAYKSGNYEEGKRRAIERFQREFVQRALERTEGNVSQAADACGMTRAALQRILRQLVSVDRLQPLRLWVVFPGQCTCSDQYREP